MTAPLDPTKALPLTPRQLEVLRLGVQGLTNKEIAYQLGLTCKTVDVHFDRIIDRLGARTRTHALLMWQERLLRANDLQATILERHVHPAAFERCPNCSGLGFVRKAAA